MTSGKATELLTYLKSIISKDLTMSSYTGPSKKL